MNMILNWYIFYFLAVEVLKSVMQKLSLAFIISHQGSFLRVMIALAQMVVLMLEDLNSILRIFGTKQLNLISNTIKDQVLPIFHMARKNDLPNLNLISNTIKDQVLSKLDHIPRALTSLTILEDLMLED